MMNMYEHTYYTYKLTYTCSNLCTLNKPCQNVGKAKRDFYLHLYAAFLFLFLFLFFFCIASASTAADALVLVCCVVGVAVAVTVFVGRFGWFLDWWLDWVAETAAVSCETVPRLQLSFLLAQYRQSLQNPGLQENCIA